MKNQIIISLGRENGSGGHFIAQKIADSLGIKLFDKELVESKLIENGFSKEAIEKADEKPINFLVSRRIGQYSNAIEANIAESTFNFISEAADSGESFVVVGRCSEFILRGNPNLVSIFVTGDKDDKIKRIMEINNLSESKAIDLIKATDRKRKSYHNYYCSIKWGDSRGYDILINTSRVGIDSTCETLLSYIKAFINI